MKLLFDITVQFQFHVISSHFAKKNYTHTHTHTHTAILLDYDSMKYAHYTKLQIQSVPNTPHHYYI